MTDVGARDLRNDTAGLVRRAASGEEIVITVRGRPAARLTALTGPPRRRWLTREELIRRLAQADPGLRADLAALDRDTTDDLDHLL
ncbi:MAG: type II toxin-antitoxin system prevent-host-death family antitoxin [Nocardioidaceae bacterium]|nr:type II toxin-antitoxin system prevent-host-death family antitoxin [Nocardioidaceae bacterium]